MGITIDSIKQKMIDKRFGRLTVLEYAGKSDYGDNLWNCRCDCGAEVVGRTANVDKPTSACTKCKRDSSPALQKRRSYLIGQVFNRLTVIQNAGTDKHNQSMWKCKCICGNEITTRGTNLLSGSTQSCGCWGRERAAELKRSHGLHDHPLYHIWAAMKDRCYNTNNKRYERYGGRGIRVHENWIANFEIFYNWAISKGYRPGLTIERIDNDGNYEPGNCRWATVLEQQQNTSRTKISPEDVFKIRNDNRTHKVIASDYGVNESTISRIKNSRTWSNIQESSSAI